MCKRITTSVLILVMALVLGIAPLYGGMKGEALTAILTGAGGHHAAGTALVTHEGNTFSLVMSDITVDRVPDGRVYLANDADYGNGVELGRLTQFTGTVTFPVPAGINPHDYNSVVIWCKRFDVEIGHGFFEHK